MAFGADTHLAKALAKMKGKKSAAGVPKNIAGKGWGKQAQDNLHQAGTPISGSEAHDEIDLDGGLDKNERPEEVKAMRGKAAPAERPEQKVFGKGKKRPIPKRPEQGITGPNEAELGWGDN